MTETTIADCDVQEVTEEDETIQDEKSDVAGINDQEECYCANGVREGVISGMLCDACRKKLEEGEICF